MFCANCHHKIQSGTKCTNPDCAHPYSGTKDVLTEPLEIQIDGDHYKSMKIQPVEYIHANGLGYFEGNVIKYITRWRSKGGYKDLEKAKHYINLLIQLEMDSKKDNPTDEPKYKHEGFNRFISTRIIADGS